MQDPSIEIQDKHHQKSEIGTSVFQKELHIYTIPSEAAIIGSVGSIEYASLRNASSCIRNIKCARGKYVLS